ncbi:MAG: hypothetical protein AAF791_15035 [Bacteroidota bacterium]
MRRLLALVVLAPFVSGCDVAGLGGDPTFSFVLEESAEGTMEGDGFAEIGCAFAGCTERFVFEDSGAAVYVFTANPGTSPSLSAVDRTIRVGRSNGTRASMELDDFGTSLDVNGDITIECLGERVRGEIAFVASFNNRPGEPVEVRGTFDMPRTADNSWREDDLPACQ